MMNTLTVNGNLLKPYCLFFLLLFSILAKAEIVKNNVSTAYNCPIEDLIINCSDDIATLIPFWLANSATDYQQSFPNGNNEYTITDDYEGNPPTAVCSVNDGGLRITFTATSLIGETEVCSANIIILDNEIVIDNCPIDNLVLSTSDEIGVAISQWLITSGNLLKLAATDSDGCDDNSGEILVTNDYTSRPSLGCQQVSGSGRLVNFTATDECGNTATCSGSIYILDEEPPFLNCISVNDITIACTDNLDANILGLPNITDNVTPTNQITLTYTDDQSGLADCGAEGTILRTFTATDQCGNMATCLQTITIINNAPILSCSPDDLVLECIGSNVGNQGNVDVWNAQNITKLGACVSDLCSSSTDLVITSDYDFNNLSDHCSLSGSLTVTYTIADECGNSVITQASYTIEDTSAPIATCDPEDTVHECNGQEGNAFAALAWNENNLTILRNCSSDDCGGVTVTSDFDFDNLSNDCGLTGSLIVVYTITDECGNSVTKTATLTIIDTTPPTTDCELIDFVIPCRNELGFKSLFANWNSENLIQLRNCVFDNCSTTFLISSNFDENLIDNNCSAHPEKVVTYTIADECGNELIKTAKYRITEEGTPLSDFCEPVNLTINCTETNLKQKIIDWNKQNLINASLCPFACTVPNYVTSDLDINAISNACIAKEVLVIYTLESNAICGYEEKITAAIAATYTIINDEIINSLCENIRIDNQNNQLTISNISAPNIITKIFDPNWQIISNCSGDCPETVTIPNLVAGEIYHTDIQFYDENWEFICADKQDVLIEGGGEPCDTSVCQGDVILRTQAEVDAFCGCEVIEGDVLIGNSTGENIPNTDIDNLSSFKKTRKIEGFFVLGKTQLLDLSGLENLEEIGGTFTTVFNPQLKNFIGFNSLKRINENIVSIQNPKLEDFVGLEKVEMVSNNIYIEGNESLSSLKGLDRLTFCENFELVRCPNIKSLKGLENLKKTSGSFTVNQNERLETTQGIENLEEIGGDLVFADNPNLGAIEGLERLEKVGRLIVFLRNNKLKSIDGLSNVKISKYLEIQENPNLSDCCTINHLIDDNTQNGQVTDTIIIANNLAFCNSIEEILLNCQTPPPLCENIQIQTQNNQIIIEGLTTPNEIVKVFDKDYNIVYQCVANCEDTQIAGTFPEGTYVVDLQLYNENWELICAEQRTVVLDNKNPCNATDCETVLPVLANIPADETVECDAIPSEPLNITATDNCDSDVTVDFNEERIDGSCQDNYVLTRTWTASDNCNNSTQGVQVIVVQDVTPPVLTNLPADLTFNEAEGFDTTFPIVTDNCAAEPTLTVEDVLNSAETEIVRTFTATDNCGNTATAQQIITIIKNETNPCEGIQITANNGTLTLTNITAPNAIVKVFDPNWQFVYECNATCENEIVIPVEGVGVYHTDIQFYDENWQFICADKQDVEVIGGGEPCDTSVCQGNVSLRTQAAVDAFCGCEVIEGNLFIGNIVGNPNNTTITDITSLHTLSRLKSVKSITIGYTQLTDLEGLNQLSTVSNGLIVAYNNKLMTTKGLDNLKYIGDNLSVYFNDELTEIDAFENIAEAKIVSVRECKSLQSVQGLKGLKKCEYISVSRNPILESLAGLEQLDSVVGVDRLEDAVVIRNNNQLRDISALRNLKFVAKGFGVQYHPVLSDCCSIRHLIDNDPDNGIILGGVFIHNNDNFCRSIQQILANCVEEETTTQCEELLITSELDGIRLSGLSAPIQIVKVFDNNYAIVYECFADCEETINLTDLTTGTYHVSINLYDANWQPICEKTETINVTGNAENRNSDFLPSDFALYPNPAETATYLDLSKLKGEKVQLELFNQFGQKVSQQVIEKVNEEKTKINLVTLQNGIYFLQIKGEGRRIVAKRLIVNRLY